jgi:hypothetical protein
MLFARSPLFRYGKQLVKIGKLMKKWKAQLTSSKSLRNLDLKSTVPSIALSQAQT